MPKAPSAPCMPTLDLDIIRNEQIRQLQDGTFAPVTLAQTVRFRRAI